MAIPQRRKVKSDEERTCTIEKQVLEGYNQFIIGERTPIIGKALGRGLRDATQHIPVAEDFKAKTFQEFFRNEVQLGLTDAYGNIFVTDKVYVTSMGTAQGERECEPVYQRNDSLKFGSYIKFRAEDDSLEGTLKIGHAGDQELVDTLTKNSGLTTTQTWKKRLSWAKEKLTREGVGGAADLVVSRILLSVYAPLAVISLGDLGRRVYNTAKIDSHWTLELNPTQQKVTGAQFNAYADLVRKYKE